MWWVRVCFSAYQLFGKMRPSPSPQGFVGALSPPCGSLQSWAHEDFVLMRVGVGTAPLSQMSPAQGRSPTASLPLDHQDDSGTPAPAPGPLA